MRLEELLDITLLSAGGEATPRLRHTDNVLRDVSGPAAPSKDFTEWISNFNFLLLNNCFLKPLKHYEKQNSNNVVSNIRSQLWGGQLN